MRTSKWTDIIVNLIMATFLFSISYYFKYVHKTACCMSKCQSIWATQYSIHLSHQSAKYYL